jgi:CheY-like chemotaxis protein
MDLRMPEMTGIEATKRIGEKLEGKHMPHIVAMTASVFEEDREACRSAGMRGFVGKPIDLVQIDTLLRRIADERGVARLPEMRNVTLAKETITALKEMHGVGEPDLLAQVTKLFLTDLEKCFPRMAEALGRDDMHLLEDETHRLKSTSAALGAVRMAELCARVEVAAREGRNAEVRGIFDKLEVERQSVERALKQETGVWGEGRQGRPEAPNVEPKVWGEGRQGRPEAPNVEPGEIL